MTPLEIIVVLLGVVVIGLGVVFILTINQIQESFKLESRSRQSQIVELHTENTRLKQRVSDLEYEFNKFKTEIVKDRKIVLPNNPMTGMFDRSPGYKTKISNDGPLGFGLRERFRNRSKPSRTSSRSDDTAPGRPTDSSGIGLCDDPFMGMYLGSLAATSMLSDPVGGGCSPSTETPSYTPSLVDTSVCHAPSHSPSVDTYSPPSFDSGSSSTFDSGSSFDSSGGCDASW